MTSGTTSVHVLVPSGFLVPEKGYQLIWLWLKNRYQNGTLVSGNMDQNPRNTSCLILSHTHIAQTQAVKVETQRGGAKL